ncbi:MAG: anaerobic ribonucleoside-triphosphate reductase [Syntrophales bacterium]|nr:anaerobic ribonucleoside-triphosphate reductase [Syntrophales bacterium]
MPIQETTDMTLFVRTSGDDIARWDRRRIVDALIRETGIDMETAETISKDVEKQIVSSGISVLTSQLIRELVDARLIERGMEKERRLHARLGFPLYDVEQLILHQNKENANVPHGPEGTNLILAEGIKREYGLHHVFSQDVSDAHAMGDIHLHALGFIDRVFSVYQSLIFLKKYGLNLPHSLTAAKPAKHAEVLMAHMVRFGAILQGYVAGSISWAAVNLSFAPYLTGMADREITQFAQMLIYEFSQMTSARGGQAMFTDIHLYWNIPAHFGNVPVLGPEGTPTGKACNMYEDDARRFAWALFDVYRTGDGTGKPFIFPRPILHITKDFFNSPGHEAFLRHVCEVAIERGNPCFAFDRSEPGAISAFGHPFPAADDDMSAPWTNRYFVIHNVTLNLPRLAYRARGDDQALFAALREVIDLAVKAHVQKRNFIEKLLSYGDEGPLSMLAMNRDGYSYLRMNLSSYFIGMVGLNELVQIHMGKPLHESEAALSFGIRVVEAMKEYAEKRGKDHGMKIILDQSHAETTSYRFARLDLKYHSPESGRFVKGDLARGEIYYTNSTQFSPSASISPMARVRGEGRFHALIQGGATTYLWTGENRLQPEALADFIRMVFEETTSRQLVIAPDFTACLSCGVTDRGLKQICSFCGSSSVENISMITQYFSRVSGWNKGKLAELRDRFRFTEL